jgi:hypothetical protein
VVNTFKTVDNRVVKTFKTIDNEEVNTALKQLTMGRCPVQYLTPGKRGNYEPPETPPRHGPGKRSRKYHIIEEDNQ